MHARSKEAAVAWDELSLREQIAEAFAKLGVGGFAAEMEERLYRRYQVRIEALREHTGERQPEERRRTMATYEAQVQAAETAPPRPTFRFAAPIGTLGHVTIRESDPLSLESLAARLRLEDRVGPGTRGLSADALAAQAARILAKDDRPGGAS
jgi:hypothetical protein